MIAAVYVSLGAAVGWAEGTGRRELSAPLLLVLVAGYPTLALAGRAFAGVRTTAATAKGIGLFNVALIAVSLPSYFLVRAEVSLSESELERRLLGRFEAVRCEQRELGRFTCDVAVPGKDGVVRLRIRTRGDEIVSVR